MRALRFHGTAILLALLFTVAATWPLARDAATHVRDLGDPLLNSWILAWDAHALATGRIGPSYFDANLFHPYRRTLAFSEHLTTQALVAAPLYLATGNPALAHNVVSLLAVATCFLGMYAFAFAATRSRLAALAAGAIYGFSPFLMSQLSHVQSLTAGGLPLAMLYLHRWLRDRRPVPLALFTVFYLLQVLANGHYALYLTLLAGAVIVAEMLRADRLRDVALWRQLVAFCGVAAVVAGPFFAPYLALREELGLRRAVTHAATLPSFLAVHPENRLYGRLLRGNLQHGEDALFPGFGAVALAMLGTAVTLRRRRATPDDTVRPIVVTIPLRKLLGGAALVTGAVVLAILADDSGLRLRVRHAANPALLLALLLVARAWVARAERREAGIAAPPAGPLGWSHRELAALYLVVLGAASLFTFGPQGPYSLLYRHVPGFDGLRVATRFHVVGTMALALLAAFGVAWLAARRRRWTTVLAVAAPLVALGESWMAPLALAAVPGGGQVPEVYRWLARQPGSPAVLELPLPRAEGELTRLECPRVYFSTVHWKPLINGYSGYLSPYYRDLLEAWARRPRFASLLPVFDDRPGGRPRYVVVHLAESSARRRRDPLRRELDAMPDRLRRVGRFGRAVVYELKPPVGGDGARR